MFSRRHPELPALFEASDGHAKWAAPSGLDAGLLLRDTTLSALVHHVERPYVVAVDMDTVEGLADDESGLQFLYELGFRVLLTRHHDVACRFSEMDGALALMRISALDTSGLDRSIESHPSRVGVGTVLSPGLVLPHIPDAKRVLLPRPLVAYGLIHTPEQIAACLAFADSVVVRHEVLLAVAPDAEGRVET